MAHAGGLGQHMPWMQAGPSLAGAARADNAQARVPLATGRPTRGWGALAARVAVGPGVRRAQAVARGPPHHAQAAAAWRSTRCDCSVAAAAQSWASASSRRTLTSSCCTRSSAAAALLARASALSARLSAAAAAARSCLSSRLMMVACLSVCMAGSVMIAGWVWGVGGAGRYVAVGRYDAADVREMPIVPWTHLSNPRFSKSSEVRHLFARKGAPTWLARGGGSRSNGLA